ncbi:MAG: hypothetical protein HXY23_08380, partial [Parvularculaceae bacterium]|nr:hypothetical protein [Parvularculaceae bacterium]
MIAALRMILLMLIVAAGLAPAGASIPSRATDSIKTDYIALPGGVTARFANNVLKYTYADHLGSPVAGASSSGAIGSCRSLLHLPSIHRIDGFASQTGFEGRENYRPYGLEMNFSAGNDNQPGFTGHLEDDRLDLVYMQA